MKYSDGQIARLGDQVHLWAGDEGVVVCSIDTGEFSKEYPRSDWAYLDKGVLIVSRSAGLVHYVEPDEDMRLIGRKPLAAGDGPASKARRARLSGNPA